MIRCGLSNHQDGFQNRDKVVFSSTWKYDAAVVLGSLHCVRAINNFHHLMFLQAFGQVNNLNK